MLGNREDASISSLPLLCRTSQNTESGQASQQLLLELAQATEEAMVSTRSHDHALQNVDTNPQPRSPLPSGKPGKRKREDDGDATRNTDPNKKRTAEKAVAVVIEQRDSRRGQQELSEKLPEDLGEAKEAETARQLDPGAEGEKGSQTEQKRLANRPKASDFISSEEPLEQKADGKEAGAQGTLTRFDDEDLDALIREAGAKSQNTIDDVHVKANPDADSDNDAPEEATTTAGHDRVTAAAAQAAEIAAKEEVVRKAKRIEHEQRMKAQSEGARKHASKRRTGLDSLKPDTGSKDGGYVQKESKLPKAPLPALLPDEILNAEPTIQAPAAHLTMTQPAKNTKKKLLLDMQDKPPKDLVRGDTKIRVLEEDRLLLPPKSSAKGQSIREKWLMGQRGPGPSAWVCRRKPLSSFARKSM